MVTFAEFAKLHMGLVVLVKKMSVLINFLLQNTNLVSVLSKICPIDVWQDRTGTFRELCFWWKYFFNRVHLDFEKKLFIYILWQIISSVVFQQNIYIHIVFLLRPFFQTFYLCNMPPLLKFKSWVPHLSGTNINNDNLLVVYYQ